MDKCPIVELGVQDTHLRDKRKKKKEEEEHLILLIKFQKQGRYVSPQKSNNDIKNKKLILYHLTFHNDLSNTRFLK